MSTDEQKADVVAWMIPEWGKVYGEAGYRFLTHQQATTTREEWKDGEYDAFMSNMREAVPLVPASTITALQERIKELEGALRPFAEKADWPLASVLEGFPIHCEAIVPGFDTGGITLASFSLTVGDFHRARSTLKDSGNGSEVAR